MRVLAILLSILAALSGAVFVLSIGGAQGAPQEASLSAMCMAVVVIPYIFVRGLEIGTSGNKSLAEKGK
jgi:hypothetical protein